MKLFPKRYALFLILFLITLVLSVNAAETALQKGFENPPDSSKPRTWWHWVSGNVSSEGITADLEAMKKIGLGGAQIFTVDQSAVKGPVVFLSPEWRKLVHQSMVQAGQLNLEIGMEGCDGWSESGGPWVTPAQSMQNVVWSESEVQGRQSTISLALPQPLGNAGYYEDIALFAFPAVAGDDCPAPDQVTASSPDFVPGRMTPTDSAPIGVTNTKPDQPLWLQYAFAQPVTCASLRLTIRGWPNTGRRGELQASDDGFTFRKICVLQGEGCFCFDRTTAKFFRIWSAKPPPRLPTIDLTQIQFGGVRISDVDARTGMAVKMGLPFEAMPLGAGDRIDPKALIDLTGRREWKAPPGKWTLIRLGHTGTGATTHPSTTAGLECDKMSRAAVESHMAHLFTPVWDDSPPQVGSTFRYIVLDSWEAGCENWTPLMRDEFKKRRGYDLWPWLPALTGRVVMNPEATERFLWDYRRTLADLVADNHYGVFQEQAHAHHMELASEATGIGMPTVADQLQCKGRCDVPMGEFWVNQTGEANVDDPKEAASAAHIYGQNIAATESFTSIPQTAAWTNDPYSLKMEGDKEFCLGVNRFVFHRYAAQPWLDRVPGMSMGPWGINFERTNTWWTKGSAWVSYLSRCQYLLQQGRFVADLCYFYGEDAPVCLHHADLKPTVPAGFDYDVCDTEILLNQMSFEDGAITLKSGMRYRVLVLPDIDRMTLPVLQKIVSLAKQGAIIYGPKPTESPSLAGYPGSDRQIQSIADAVWGNCDGKTVTEHAYGNGRVVWGEPLKPVIGTPPDFESTRPDMLYIHRVAEASDIYFVSNQEDREQVAECTFRVTGKAPEVWHPDSGKIEKVALYRHADGRTTLPLHLDPSGSVFVIFRRSDADVVSLDALQYQGQKLFADDAPPAAEVPVLSGNDKVTLLAWKTGSYVATTTAGNTLRADVPELPEPLTENGPWQIQFQPKRGAPEKATFNHLISWPDSSDEGIKYFSGTASYRGDLAIPAGFLETGRHAWLDLGDVKNLAEVSVNGKSLGILWKAPFRVDVTGPAISGLNHLEIKVTNLWPNRLIGDQKLPKDRQITWASVSLYKADSKLLPSGLLGPVRLIPAQEVTLAP
jgi:hypothetical protein